MEKLLVMSNFSFSNSVFKRLELQTRKYQGLFGKGNQSVENAGVAFVKGANERNEFLEKINKH